MAKFHMIHLLALFPISKQGKIDQQKKKMSLTMRLWLKQMLISKDWINRIFERDLKKKGDFVEIKINFALKNVFFFQCQVLSYSLRIIGYP